ncbi:GNAT family N-acetyltransferase [Prosthecobacter sp.]|uniref:GNAT family N-acetyltransferase n=1 Tax=Prosthecobacter sp. TaxID=1965333 RepID=UPI003784E45E
MSIAITPEIHLSAITMADAEDINAHLRDYEVSRYTLLIPHPYTLAMAHEWIAIIADDVQRNGRETIWAIRESSGRMIGAVELHVGSAGKQHVSEIGYWLAKSHWGRGIMTAVVKAVAERGFRELGVRRITAPIFAPNVGSARVLEKSGFVVEAPLLRLAYHRDGQFYDGRLYALVREE